MFFYFKFYHFLSIFYNRNELCLLEDYRSLIFHLLNRKEKSFVTSNWFNKSILFFTKIKENRKKRK